MIRYALTCGKLSSRSRVHRVRGDEARNALCGVCVSESMRYSRRSVYTIRQRQDCRNCLSAVKS